MCGTWWYTRWMTATSNNDYLRKIWIGKIFGGFNEIGHLAQKFILILIIKNKQGHLGSSVG